MKRGRQLYVDDENRDRFTDLPICVLLHILSFLKTKQAVRTCILSTRWKNLWKHLPTLRLNSLYFDNLHGFMEFVARILSLRDDSTALSYLKFRCHRIMEPHLLESILQYAVSHGIQRLRIYLYYNIEHIPLCIFSCHTLTSLTLNVRPIPCDGNVITLFPSSLNLPALSSLDLRSFVFRSGDGGCAEPFSVFKKLNRLAIRFCRVLDSQNLCISSVTLANLTIQTHYIDINYHKIELYTPSLSAFSFAGTPFQISCGSHLCSIKHVKIDAYMCWNNAQAPSNLLSWLIKLTDIESLTISSITLQVLFSIPDLLKVKFTSLCNLKSLKVKMKGKNLDELYKSLIDVDLAKLPDEEIKDVVIELRKEIKEGFESFPSIRDRIVGFLLQNSPLAKVDFI